MKKKTNSDNLSIPMKDIKQFEHKHIGCWETVKYMRDGQGKAYPYWHPQCHIPIAACNAIKNEYYPNAPINFSNSLACFSAWRQYKEIYSFDGEMSRLLMSQNIADDPLPVEILLQLPYPCIYIIPNCEGIVGFYVWIEIAMWQDRKEEFEMCFLIHTEQDGDISLTIQLRDNETLYESIDRVTDEVKGRYKIPLESEEYYKNLAQTLLGSLLQLVLYLCAAETDVEENPEQKLITRKSAPNSEPKDVYREIRKWDVGYRISYAMRKHSCSMGTGEPHEHKSAKRPHSRRGHWHHYWIGKKDDRRLILKWTAPTWIHGDIGDIITTVNKL